MYTDQYFEHLSACDNDFEVLTQFMRLALPDFDEERLMEIIKTNSFDLAMLLSANFSSLQGDNCLGTKGAMFLKFLKIIISRYHKTKLRNKNILANIADVNEFLSVKMSSVQEEYILLLLLDSRNFLINEEVLSLGTCNQVYVHPQLIIKKVIEKNASAFIIAHNHPSGDPSPSPSDIEFSRFLYNICITLSINFHDHIIVGQNKITSMRASGLIGPRKTYRSIKNKNHDLALTK